MRDEGKIAYQGVPGAFGERAARHFGGDARCPLPCPTFETVFAELSSGHADYAVVPYENSLAGAVEPISRLLERETVVVLDRLILPIKHALIGSPGMRLLDVRRVYSHAVALRQCRKLFRAHSHWQAREAEDTAGAVEFVVKHGARDQAALADRHSAALYGGTILLENVQDSADNRTSFYLLAKPFSSQPISQAECG
jgi:prephenate dehydratase